MSRAATSTLPARATRLAAVHRQGDAWRIVVIESGDGTRLIEATTVIGDLRTALAEAQRRHNFVTLVRVAPGRATIARAAGVPAAGPEETASALSLLAEAQLPASLPAHRRAAGLIADGGSNGTRAVLLTGWDGPADPPGSILRRIPECWTTEIAALAFLRGGRTPLAASADPSSGAVSILATGPQRTAARVLVEDAGSPARFRQSASRAIAETCAAVGVESPAREAPVLSLDGRAASHLRSAVSGVPDVRGWLDEYGLALGAALAAATDDPLSRSLALMREDAPAKHAPIVARGAAWLARPRNAWITAAACAAFLLLGPLAFAAARLAILEAKSAGLADRTRQRADERTRDAFYEQLQASRWPMTKLLADVSAAAPVGVVADSILLSPEQGLSIQGTAESPEQVDTFQANLNATRLFTSVKSGRVATSSSGVEFDLTASVSNPHAKATGADDFAARPLAVRLYGEGASNTASPASGGAPAERPAPRSVRRADPDRTESPRAERSEGERESRRPSAAASTEPPPPLTDEQINAMNNQTATAEWVKRRTYPQKNAGIDAALKSRLEDEARKLRERMDATRGGGG